MGTTLTVPAKFNGPVDSGNGGYSAGLFASGLGDAAAAEVTLRSPIPLDRPIAVEEGEGEGLRFADGETLIAEARPAPEFDPEPPFPVSLEEARRASEKYPAPSDGLFSSCFVCARAREDSFEVFAGPLEGRSGVASAWTPPEWTADEEGRVRREFLWSVLDCPTYFAAFAGGELPLAFLARMTCRIHSAAIPGEDHVVVAWPLGSDGRKHRAAAAVLTSGGEVLAIAEALMIEPR